MFGKVFRRLTGIYRIASWFSRQLITIPRVGLDRHLRSFSLERVLSNERRADWHCLHDLSLRLVITISML